MRVELLAVGTELLLGDIVNGNAAWLGRRLAEVGLDVTTSVVVGDNVSRIGDTLRQAFDRADALVLTGGLGPTQDDVTREALAAVAGVPIRRDATGEQLLRAHFESLGRTVPERNYRQADVPEGAVTLPNTRGTAPGLRMELLGGVAYALPGPPHEMQAMFEASVLPDLLERAGEPSVIVSRVLRTAGIWESAVAEALAGLVESLEPVGNPTIAFLASGGQTRVRITAKAADEARALELLEPVEAAARQALGENVYGDEHNTLAGVVHAQLRQRDATLAVAESLTAGALGAALTDVVGSGVSFRGGITAYASELKSSLLGVPPSLLETLGPVSGEVAVAMAEGVRTRLGATYGLSLTGVAGPDDQDGKPVGLVYAGLAWPGGATVRELHLGGDRPRVRMLATVNALDALRRHLCRPHPDAG